MVPCASLIVAGLFAWGTQQIAAHVREYNGARAAGGLFIAGMLANRGAGGDPGTSPGHIGLPALPLPGMVGASSPAADDGDISSKPRPGAGDGDASDSRPPAAVPELPLERLTRATAHAETIVFVWERVMYGVAAVLGLAGVVGLATSWVRVSHLIAAIVVLLSAVGTIVGMRLLVSPDGGAFHELSVKSYVVAGVVQSLYGWVLLGVFRLRPAGTKTSTVAGRG
ncbi:MAG: hypothetical protein HY718_18705 [Planctomycetes bacterium]|nr:hypothetical protein [Planctomycetota bacterium]